MVGMPYANKNDPVLQEKMAFLDKKRIGGEKKLNADDYYENLCMKSVNQSIGMKFPHQVTYFQAVPFDTKTIMPLSCCWTIATTRGRFGNDFLNGFKSGARTPLVLVEV